MYIIHTRGQYKFFISRFLHFKSYYIDNINFQYLRFHTVFVANLSETAFHLSAHFVVSS